MNDFDLTCPAPISQYPEVLLAHGGGGRLMHQLLDRVFLSAFRNRWLDTGHDAAVLEVAGGREQGGVEGAQSQDGTR